MAASVNISVLTRRGGMIDRDMERRAIRVETRAKVLCPVDRGALRASIHRERGRQPLSWSIIADRAYASWIHRGRRFDPRAGRIVVARAGPRPFLVGALSAAFGR